MDRGTSDGISGNEKNILARREALAHHAAKPLSGLLTLSNIEAGLQTVSWLRKGFLGEEVCSAAARQNIDVVPLDRYCRKSVLPRPSE